MTRIYPLTNVVLLVMVLFFCVCIDTHAQKTSPPERMPWTLREHYTFGGELLRMDYAKDNAEWRVKMFQPDSEEARMFPDVILRDVGFCIELGDGRILTHEMLGYGGETIFAREPFDMEYFGEGTCFSVQFAPHEGIAVEHKISRFRNWNFLLIAIAVKNNTEQPITVTRIQSAMLGPGALSGLSESAQVNSHNFIFRGGHPVFTRDGGAVTMRIYDPVRNVSMALGLLPSGLANSIVDIQPGGGAWQGRIESSFAPGAVIAPGASLESDPIWFCIDVSQVVADAQYAFLLSRLCRSDTTRHLPRAWVTIPDTQGLSALKSEAADAKGMGITHALIPGNWEGRPGSFEGGAPQYPRNIGDAAKSLRDAGVVPGITIDPLLGSGGSSDWTGQSVDGRSWINLATEGGREFAVKRIRRLVTAGFGLIAIENSPIPDEILQAFKITRAQAQTLCFDVANEAAAGAAVSVLPTAIADLNINRDEWLEAAGALSRMDEFTVAVAPVRMRSNSSGDLNSETMLALRCWRGPIEFVGAPGRPLQSKLPEILNNNPLPARPQDAYRKNPLVWLLRCDAASIGYVGASVISFPGADAWDVRNVETFGVEDKPTLLWRPDGNKPLSLSEGVIPAAPQFATHGVLLNTSQPIFAGTTENLTLGLNRLKRLSWDAGRGILTGLIDPAPGVSDAFFLAPSNLALRAARIGSKPVRPVIDGPWITLPIGSGGAFELEFVAR